MCVYVVFITEEGGEESTKDVAKLLKEVLRLRQKGNPAPIGTTGKAGNSKDAEDEDDDEGEDDEV